MKVVKELLHEDMGGVSAPMATPANVPGVGNPTPAGVNQIGSGDKWSTSKKPYTQTSRVRKKKKVKMKAKIVSEENVSPYDKIGELILKKAKIKRVFKKKKEAGNQNAVKQVVEYAGQNRAIGFNYEKQKTYTFMFTIKLDVINVNKLKRIQNKFEDFLERLDISYFFEISRNKVLIGFKAVNKYESYSILDEIEKFLEINNINLIKANFKDSVTQQNVDVKDFLKRERPDVYKVTNIGPRFQKYEHQIIDLDDFLNE